MMMISRTQTLFLIINLSALSQSEGADILVGAFMPSPSSHARSLSAIARALVRRGHNVTILTSSYAGPKGFREDTYTNAIHFRYVDKPPGYRAEEGDVLKRAFESSLIVQFTALLTDIALMRGGCECLFEDPSTLALLNESRFDLLIGDSFEGCHALLSSYLSIPYIAVSTTTRYPFFNEHLYGIPSPSSYIPFGLLPLSDRMSFRDRIESWIEHHILVGLILRWNHFRAMERIKDKHDIAPDRSIEDLIGRAELWMSVSTFALDYPHPTSPNWVAIGNVADAASKPLDMNYASFVEGSGEHGFIIFSLGSHIPELPTPEMAEAFAQVFSELQQRVIWRYTGTRPRYLGNNTMIVDWMPQNDLMGHPNARLLICHGGLSGVLEAVYHAVPMVIMPIFSDQESNALKVEVKGMGRRLRKDVISYDTVKAVVNEVLNNPSYQQNVRQFSGIYKDTHSRPDDTIIYWVEHILKFGGSHLKSRALDLNFIQLHSIDVVAFFVMTVAGVVFLLYSCGKRCLSCCFQPRKWKRE